MPRGEELARRRMALLARGQQQRARWHQRAGTLRDAGARIDRVLRVFPGAVSMPVLAGAATLLVMALGRQRSLRLAAGALGLWATLQRFRQLGAGLGLLADRYR